MTDSPLPRRLGRYTILRELGRGAMGVVYEGQDPQLGRRVALKTARPELISGPNGNSSALKRFFREARVAGMLNHPNIITVYDAGEQDGVAFIAMEYVEGQDLGTRLAQGPRYPVCDAVELAATLAEALAFAHERGVVHRDVKPANILLPNTGPPKLTDFGIAHVVDSTLTQEGALIGSPTYMSPEQFMGQRVDGRSDLFSLAVVLYEMLTGERPFTGTALSTVMHHVLNSDPAPPRALNFAVDERLSQVVLKALAKAPQDRFPTGGILAAALRDTLNALSESATPSPSLQATVRMRPLISGVAPEPNLTSTTIPGSPDTGEVYPKADLVDGSRAFPTNALPETASEAAKRHRGKRHAVSAGLVLVAILALMAGLKYFQRTHTVYQTAPPKTLESILPSDPVEQTRLKVSVFATAHDEEYFRYQQILNSQQDTARYIREAAASGRIQPLTGAGYSVGVFDPLEPTKPFSTETLTEDGNALLLLPEAVPRLKFEVYWGQNCLSTLELPASVCQKPQTFLVLCPKCIPSHSELPAPLAQ